MDALAQRLARPRTAALLTALVALAVLGLAQRASAQVAFSKALVGGTSSAQPTSLQWGPDGRLYVASQQGTIQAYTIARTGPASYQVAATETISALLELPNHNDSGAVVPAVTGRLVTGLLVTGTAQAPVIYAVSSDPRIQAGVDNDVDTNSGVLSRLTKTGGGWTRADLVRGLPRSEENHTSNGLALSADGQTLYLGQGGLTNKGAPSLEFSFVPEYALSAAILSINLASPAVQAGYNIPTLAGTATPFGGQNGANQAILTASGPVQVFAPGFRNPYDVVLTQAGHLFTVDNGANPTWGDEPDETTCSSTTPEDGGAAERDALHLLSPGYYGGHPNPTRGNAGNFPGAVPASDSRQCTYLSPGTPFGPTPPKENDNLVTFGSSTNGLVEYTASNFGGALKGDLLAGSFDNAIHQLDLNGAGTGLLSKTILVSNVTSGGQPLDVTAVGDTGAYPGTVWWADVYTSAIGVLEPADFAGGSFSCDPSQPDADGDGFSNADETANGSNICSPADTPPDFDGDKVSDRADADDDNDGSADLTDVFARDKDNGLATKLPITYTWENTGQQLGGILGLGFTGLMANGVTDYLDQFNPDNITAGGAAGVTTVDQIEPGDAVQNTQKYGLQFGVDAHPTAGAFTVRSTLVNPFAGQAPTGSQSMGVYLGTGDQDNYVKVVATAQGGGGVQVLSEVDKSIGATRAPLALPGPQTLELLLQANPQTGQVQALYAANGGAAVPVGAPVTVPGSWFSDCARGLAVGIISTSVDGPPFAATWDSIAVTPDGGSAGATPAVRCPQGGGGGGGGGQAGDTTKPAITKLSVRPKRFKAMTKGSTLVPVRWKGGSRVSFRLSEDAKVRFTAEKARAGKRRGKSCVKPTRSNRRAKSCTRYVAVKGSITRPFKAGTPGVKFSGRMAKRRLVVGKHRLVLRATDAAGNASTRRVVFTITRR